VRKTNIGLLVSINGATFFFFCSPAEAHVNPCLATRRIVVVKILKIENVEVWIDRSFYRSGCLVCTTKGIGAAAPSGNGIGAGMLSFERLIEIFIF
jgi:hypothetical protein